MLHSLLLPRLWQLLCAIVGYFKIGNLISITAVNNMTNLSTDPRRELRELDANLSYSAVAAATPPVAAVIGRGRPTTLAVTPATVSTATTPKIGSAIFKEKKESKEGDYNPDISLTTSGTTKPTTRANVAGRSKPIIAVTPSSITPVGDVVGKKGESMNKSEVLEEKREEGELEEEEEEEEEGGEVYYSTDEEEFDRGEGGGGGGEAVKEKDLKRKVPPIVLKIPNHRQGESGGEGMVISDEDHTSSNVEGGAAAAKEEVPVPSKRKKVESSKKKAKTTNSVPRATSSAPPMLMTGGGGNYGQNGGGGGGGGSVVVGGEITCPRCVSYGKIIKSLMKMLENMVL